jgi:hypothetical protein
VSYRGRAKPAAGSGESPENPVPVRVRASVEHRLAQ